MKRLDETFDVLVENDVIEQKLSSNIKQNIKFELRPYQIDALSRLNYYLNNYKDRRKPSQILFHMATGSGKTLIMASAIIELYKLGYRNFIFFVNTDTIIRKTKENFLNPNSSKYLFKDIINIDGEKVQIREVSNFEGGNNDDINIIFSTIQGLHSKLNTPQENNLTFEDFENKKVVLISDEAHHINTLTKKKPTKEEVARRNSWEYTVTTIFESNPENILMEYTATLELSHPSVAAKYCNKLLYDYPLARYREDGYSKEVQTNQIDFDPIDRALVGIIISQYKKKIFSKNGLLIKPVVMMKSKTTNESSIIEAEFRESIKNLNSEKITNLKSLDNDNLKKAFDHFKSVGISDANLIDELQDDFSEDKIISINSKNDSNEKQIVINSLEDKENEYRVVFAVDKLNEGWDVLNLFDIVRLYDTRDAKGTKPGKTTVQEAQLIGRGARYCPFQLEDSQELYKRKFDKDLDNELRVCEMLHYHCSHNPKYIQELRTALKEIGILPDERVEVQLDLKDNFKASKFYRSGFILLNKKVENTPELLLEYQEPSIRTSFDYKLRTNRSKEEYIFDDIGMEKSYFIESKEHALINWDKTIIKKAMNKIPFYCFDKLKRFFPSLSGVDEFISNEKYLGKIIVAVNGLSNDVRDLSPVLKLDICLKVLKEIADEIYTKFGDYRGTQAFDRVPIQKIFRDKKLSFALNKNSDKETGKATMRSDIPKKYYTNLKEKDWYVYTDNYGTSEEKFLVKFLDSQMLDLEEKFDDIFLLRNERFFKLFRFSDAKAVEPDFVLFMTDGKKGEELIYQLFIEPKGEHLIANDIWKEEFLAEIEESAKVELFQNENFRLIGMPFYNEVDRKDVFREKLSSVGL